MSSSQINIASKKSRLFWSMSIFSLLLLGGISIYYMNTRPDLGESNDLLAVADIENGKAISQACTACHSIFEGERNIVGPNLFGIVGAKRARNKTYPYSDALLKMKDKTWTTDALYEWLGDPAEFAPGTKMPYNGLLDPQDRMDLIAYLISINK